MLNVSHPSFRRPPLRDAPVALGSANRNLPPFPQAGVAQLTTIWPVFEVPDAPPLDEGALEVESPSLGDRVAASATLSRRDPRPQRQCQESLTHARSRGRVVQPLAARPSGWQAATGLVSGSAWTGSYGSAFANTSIHPRRRQRARTRSWAYLLGRLRETDRAATDRDRPGHHRHVRRGPRRRHPAGAASAGDAPGRGHLRPGDERREVGPASTARPRRAARAQPRCGGILARPHIR
jgi:hypothetical protein